MRTFLPCVALAAFLSAPSQVAAQEGYFRFPAHKGDKVFFVAEGDIWTAPLNGGKALRLTTHVGQETRPVISPDGKWIAFSASYEGSSEAYVMPAEGGLPKRIAFDGGSPVGWTPKGEVLYVCSSSKGPSGQRVLVQVNPNTLARTPIPLADANDGCFDDSGKFLYFIRMGIHMMGDNAKNYRGGAMAELWSYEHGTAKEAVKINVPGNGNIKRPMWWKDRLYFIGDSDGTDNIWSIKPDGTDATKVTKHSDWDVRYAYLSEGKITYQLGADVHVLDLSNNQDRTVKIDLVSDFEQMRKRSIRATGYMNNVSLSPTGEKIVFTARGSVAVAGLQNLRRVDLATPSGSRITAATLSKDGKWVYAFSDANGEKQIWRYPADGSVGGEALTKDKGLDRSAMYPSPDGKYLAHSDRSRNLWLLNLDTKDNQLIDSNNYSSTPSATWSADSKNIAIQRQDTSHGSNQILLYSLDSKQKAAVTSDKYESFSPAFSPDGKWLYFLSNRTFSVVNGSPWGDRNMGPYFDRRTKMYAIALQDGLTFPFQAKTELDAAAPEPRQDRTPSGPRGQGGPAGARGGEDSNEPREVKLPAIQFNGLANRVYELPLPASNYQNLSADARRLYFMERDGGGAAGRGGGGGTAIKTLEISNNDPRPEVFLADAGSYTLSLDGKKIMLTRRSGGPGAGGPGGADYYIVDAGARAPQDLAKFAVRISDWTITADPRAEWRQMFYDAWRMHRDRFFDSKLRGVNWEGMKKKYEHLIDRITDRNELSDLLSQMMGELGAMHSQVRAGDQRSIPDSWAQAHLGATFSKAADGYRIDHIYRTENELPSEAGPLAKQGMDVREGDIITSINGRPVLETRDISDLLVNQAGQQVLLGLKRGQTQLKPIIVTPVNSAQNGGLRYSDWEENNRLQVEKASNGRMGYLHLRAMGGNDINTFAREFYANVERDGLIIDVRRNNGGNIDSWVIEKLLRRAWAFWTTPDGMYRGVNMQQTFRGHIVVLIDEYTYSDGETFAEGIKQLGIAPLVGRRTSGAGAWLTDSNGLIDGGMIRVAEWPQFATKDGSWLIEGVGVSPDIEVVNPPLETFNGKDRQLETAIKVLQDKLKASPIPELKPKGIPSLKK
ncbi:MAG: PDZ domain-containing protein [Holophagales bacterium]|nr:PDZ domain-containing protein [Holophagales bacterium]